jgi:hypothetical protein
MGELRLRLGLMVAGEGSKMHQFASAYLYTIKREKGVG